MKKLVGVMPLWDDEKDSIWMLPGYMAGLAAAGTDAFIFPMTEDEDTLSRLIGLCDGFLLTGGHDVNPARYGETPANASVVWNDVRDHMDSFVLRCAVQEDKAVLGICRGIQLINAALGGTLFQDLPLEHPSRVDHHMNAPYDRPAHAVEILPDTPLFALIGKTRMEVNSIHHQAVRRLAPGLKPMAVSEDGLTEAVYMPGRRFIWGIQWHPEYWFAANADCMKIFQCFAAHL